MLANSMSMEAWFTSLYLHGLMKLSQDRDTERQFNSFCSHNWAAWRIYACISFTCESYRENKLDDVIEKGSGVISMPLLKFIKSWQHKVVGAPLSRAMVFLLQETQLVIPLIGCNYWIYWVLSRYSNIDRKYTSFMIPSSQSLDHIPVFMSLTTLWLVREAKNSAAMNIHLGSFSWLKFQCDKFLISYLAHAWVPDPEYEPAWWVGEGSPMLGIAISNGATFNQVFTTCLTCTWWSSFVQIAIIITGVPWDPGDLNGNGLGSSRIFRRGECHVLEMITGSKEALGWASGHGPSGIATSCAKREQLQQAGHQRII